MLPLPNELVEAVAADRAVLFVGAGFSHGVTGLDWNALLEALRHKLPDSSGWEYLDPLDRAQLFVQSQGRDELERELASLLPTADALHGEVTDFHRKLIGMPFPIIVTTNYDGLVEATLADLDEPFRVVIDPEEVAAAVSVDDGCRLVIKMHGDLVLGDTIVLTREDYLNYDSNRPAIVSLLESLFLTRTFFFYGFGLSDPNFLLIFNQVMHKKACGGPSYAMMREPNTVMASFWAARKVYLIPSRNYAEMEAQVAALANRVQRRRADEWDLDTVLGTHFPDDHEEIVGLLEEVHKRFADRLQELEPFLWVNLTADDLESYNDDTVDDVLGAFRVLRALARGGFPVPPTVLAQAGELLAKFKLHNEARAALELALRLMRRERGSVTPKLRSSLARVMCRLGDFERARVFLERALEEGDPGETWLRAAEMAWLTRCVLERLDRLKTRRRHRAVMEAIAAFLQRQAPRLSIALIPPPDDDPPARWSIYYINLRVGRIMAMAAEMAAAAGQVYAAEAIDYLTRAIEVAPFKPEPYRVLKPLLLESRYGTADPERWSRLIEAAPPEALRKLGIRAAPVT
jgi:tetratricopeptide (TPR) repeat protein